MSLGASHLSNDAVLFSIRSSVATRVAERHVGVFCMGVGDEDKESPE